MRHEGAAGRRRAGAGGRGSRAQRWWRGGGDAGCTRRNRTTRAWPPGGCRSLGWWRRARVHRRGTTRISPGCAPERDWSQRSPEGRRHLNATDAGCGAPTLGHATEAPLVHGEAGTGGGLRVVSDAIVIVRRLVREGWTATAGREKRKRAKVNLSVLAGEFQVFFAP